MDHWRRIRGGKTIEETMRPLSFGMLFPCRSTQYLFPTNDADESSIFSLSTKHKHKLRLSPLLIPLQYNYFLENCHFILLLLFDILNETNKKKIAIKQKTLLLLYLIFFIGANELVDTWLRNMGLPWPKFHKLIYNTILMIYYKDEIEELSVLWLVSNKRSNNENKT